MAMGGLMTNEEFAEALRNMGLDEETVQKQVSIAESTEDVNLAYGGAGLPVTGTSILPVQYNGEYYDPSDMTTPIATNWEDANQYMADQSLLWNTQPTTDEGLDFGGGGDATQFGEHITPIQYEGEYYLPSDLENPIDMGEYMDWGTANPVERTTDSQNWDLWLQYRDQGGTQSWTEWMGTDDNTPGPNPAEYAEGIDTTPVEYTPPTYDPATNTGTEGGYGDPLTPPWMDSGGTGGGAAPPPTYDYQPWTPDLSADRPSWSWDYFSPKAPGDGGWGGYDSDYGVFERYQPGQESPWGMPDVSGGNEQFYQQQFNNLLRDEQDFRTRQRAAQLRAYDADQAKQAAIEGGTYNPNFDDMWASMGVYPSQASSGLNPGEGGQSGPSWELNPNFNFTTDTSNADVFRTLIGQPGFSEYQDKASDWLEAHPEWDTAYNWARTGDPNTLISQLGNQGPLAGSNYDMFQQVFNNLYSQVGTGSSAPPGYVNPTAGVV